MRAVGLVILAVCVSVLYGQETVVPDDPYFVNQVSFHNEGGTVSFDMCSYFPRPVEFDVQPDVALDMTHAWMITRGSRDVVVALIDDGFFYYHEDLRANIWENIGEVGLDAYGYEKSCNGRDDDGNGYKDDVMGWDFVFGDPDPDPYIFDGKDRNRVQPYWHSVGAMGIIGAVGNNGVGVAGINWEVSLMLLKVAAQGFGMDDIDTLRLDRAAEAIRYAADNGARVINWSGFVRDDRPHRLAILKEAIAYAASKGVLLVTGAGNYAKNLEDAANYTYPQCFDLDNIINVAEVDYSGDLYHYEIEGRSFGSSYGATRVHIGAIGDNYTTFLKNNVSVYALGGGTSNAAPVVSGVAALVLSVRPDLDYRELKGLLLDSVTPVQSLQGKIVSGGVVNARRALEMALNYRLR